MHNLLEFITINTLVVLTPHLTNCLQDIPLYKEFNSKYNGKISLIHAIRSPVGLSHNEKQFILDYHNAIRAKVARGNLLRAADGPLPPAANMLAMEWDDLLAEYSQKYAETCPEIHNRKPIEFPYNGTRNENLQGSIITLESDMLEEVRNWNFWEHKCNEGEQCGHYRTIVEWSQIRVGCGWKYCKERKYRVMVCNYAPFSTSGLDLEFNTKRAPFQREFWPGPACSKCPKGFDFCMSNSLCATKKQCDESVRSRCKCLVDKRCIKNGGKPDRSCRCLCPPGKSGTNCEDKCEDFAEICTNCGQQGYQDSIFLCQKTCNGCQKISDIYRFWYRTYPPFTFNKFTVNAAVKQCFRKKRRFSNTSQSSCKNLESDSLCICIRQLGYCRDHFDASKWRYYCQRSCNSCGFQALFGNRS